MSDIFLVRYNSARGSPNLGHEYCSQVRVYVLYDSRGFLSLHCRYKHNFESFRWCEVNYRNSSKYVLLVMSSWAKLSFIAYYMFCHMASLEKLCNYEKADHCWYVTIEVIDTSTLNLIHNIWFDNNELFSNTQKLYMWLTRYWVVCHRRSNAVCMIYLDLLSSTQDVKQW
jgi:hypothetical protein